MLIQAGTGDGNGNGGDTTISGGLRAGSGTDGDVIIKTGSSGVLATAVTVDEAQNTTLGGHLIITSATDGIAVVYSSSGTVTQATNHSTGVTLNSTSGVITLAGVALAAGAEADFAVTNSTVQSDSVILLTVQSPAAASATNNATLVAQLDEVNNGSFNVRLSKSWSR